MSVPFYELDGSPSRDRTREGATAHRKGLIPWSMITDFERELMGDDSMFGGTSYAKFPGMDLLRVARVHSEPCHDDQIVQLLEDIESDLAQYESYAEVTIDYAPLPESNQDDLPEPEPGTFLTYRMGFGGEYMTIPFSALHWESDPTRPVRKEAVAAMRVPIIEHFLTWHRVVNPPWGAIRSCWGGVNNAPYLQLGGGVGSIGTVLFDGATAATDFQVSDDFDLLYTGWKLDYVFREKNIRGMNYKVGEGEVAVAVGWNHSYREHAVAGEGVWDRLLNVNDEPRHHYCDFAQLTQYVALPADG